MHGNEELMDEEIYETLCEYASQQQMVVSSLEESEIK